MSDKKRLLFLKVLISISLIILIGMPLLIIIKIFYKDIFLNSFIFWLLLCCLDTLLARYYNEKNPNNKIQELLDI